MLSLTKKSISPLRPLRAWLLAGALMLSLTSARAEDLYQLTWRGTVYQSVDGRIVSRKLTEKDLVRQVAENNGLDPKTLTLVYRADKRDTAVVRLADGSFVGNVTQMEYVWVDAATRDGSLVYRHAFLFDEGHEAAIGSAYGTERVRKDASGVRRSYSFRGTFQYSYPDTGEIFSGTFSTGKKIEDRTAG